MVASVIDSVPFCFPSSVDVALELENATQPVPWEGSTWWFHGGGQKGSAGGKKKKTFQKYLPDKEPGL